MSKLTIHLHSNISTALAIFKPEFGDFHKEFSSTHHYIGNAFIKRTEYDKSLEYLKRAIHGEESRRGKIV